MEASALTIKWQMQNLRRGGCRPTTRCGSPSIKRLPDKDANNFCVFSEADLLANRAP